MDSKKKKYIERLIDENGVYPVYQPIISLRDGNVLGYEALTRIKSKFQQLAKEMSIEEMFCEAEKDGQIWKLDYLCRKSALKKYYRSSELKNKKMLFLNVSPKIMEDKRFETGFTSEYLQRYYAAPNSIVFEITEREAIEDQDNFIKAIEHYRSQEYQIAVDDVGSGYSGIERILNVNPEYLKINISLIRDIHKDGANTAFVRGLLEFANLYNIKIIAEGIEKKEELEKLIQMGVHYGQGYFLGKPEPELTEMSQEIKNIIWNYNQQKHKAENYTIDNYYIKNICGNVLTVNYDKKVSELLDYIRGNLNQPGICVCEDQKVLGIMTRENFMQMLSGRYGFSLNQNKEIGQVMNRQFLSVDYEMSISTVSEMAMNRDNSELYDFIIVTSGGKYYGVVTVKDLLIQATRINIMAARDANPLTGLPGNGIIENRIEGCITGERPYGVLYIDLDNFKEYNDIYGFEKGDMVIKTLADILRDIFGEIGFIGHVGGDDFVVILNDEDIEFYENQIDSEFDSRVKALYTAEDVEKGYVIAAGRNGDIERFPLVSATVVGTSKREHNYKSQFELTEELAKRKKKAKKKKKEKFRNEGAIK